MTLLFSLQIFIKRHYHKNINFSKLLSPVHMKTNSIHQKIIKEKTDLIHKQSQNNIFLSKLNKNIKSIILQTTFLMQLTTFTHLIEYYNFSMHIVQCHIIVSSITNTNGMEIITVMPGRDAKLFPLQVFGGATTKKVYILNILKILLV